MTGQKRNKFGIQSSFDTIVILYTDKTNYYQIPNPSPHKLRSYKSELSCVSCSMFGFSYKERNPQRPYCLFCITLTLTKSINRIHNTEYVQKQVLPTQTHFLMKETPFSMLPANSFFAFSKPTLFYEG